MTTQVSDGRDESAEERSDRNWAELLQELRVMQMGVQILTGFLLTLPFQQRFATELRPGNINVQGTIERAHVNGALVGGASLKAADFGPIVAALSAA